MSDNPQGTGEITLNDAVSLLVTPPEDTVAGEQEEAIAPQPPEDETSQVEDDTAEEAIEDEIGEVEDDEGEDAYEADDEEEDEEPLEQVYTVKVDGEDIEVTLDELQNGYSRQQAYTKRSMELAEQRKAFEAEQAEVTQLRDAYAQQLDQLAAQIQQAGLQQEPDWRALAETMSERDLFLAKAEYDQQKEYQKQVEAEQKRVAAEQARENEKKMRVHLEEQRADMLNRIPAWQDTDIRETERQQVITYAQRRIGFSEEEIASATDARAIELLYKAWRWDTLQDKAPAAKKRTRKAPKMAKAGRPKTKREVANRSRQDARKRFEAAGTVDAALDYLMSK
ncbi:MAG: hypothetical protein DWQ28_06475 [Proteobacteria bacterium]|nr:MAG: hypothetical protein DWQ28_06170 [Pseudomonadota bacterium]REJ67677.1 MAG: hypothetical protein DWQ28_06475 [Pseudomonadota bacterium]